MVPDNQKIRLEPIGLNAFRYEATAIGHSAGNPQGAIPAGSWTIMFHHGSAYSLKLLGLLFGMVPPTAPIPMITNTPRFPTRGAITDSGKTYWGLRFGGYTDAHGHHVRERLEVLKASEMRN